MNPFSQKHLVEFLKTVKESITKKEFVTAFTLLKEYVENTKSSLETKVELAIKMLDRDKLLREIDEKHNEVYSKVDNKNELHTKQLGTVLDNKIKDLQKTIPKEFDPKNLEDKIQQVRDEIPEIPEIPTLDTGAQIVDKINDLPTDDDSLKIGIEHIKGLLKELKELREMKSSGGRVISGPRRYMVSKYSLTSQCNGVTKAFTLPIDTVEVLGVFGSQFPVQYDPSGDWTFSGRTLTLGSSVGAPETSQTLWALIQTLN